MKRLVVIAQVAAVLGLSAVSVYTTALGLTFLMPLLAAWIAACSIQVVLVGAAASIRTAVGGARATAYACVYAIAVCFSVAGSFVAYDQVFSLTRRSALMDSKLRDLTNSYIGDIRRQAVRLGTTSNAQVERVRSKLEFERSQGVLSKNGAGFGPRSAAISTLRDQAVIIERRVAESANKLDVVTEEANRLPNGTGSGSFQIVATRARGIGEELAALDEELADLLERERHLGNLAGDPAAVRAVPWPEPLSFAGFDESRSAQVVVRAYGDLIDLVPGTVVSMIAAIFTDVLLLLVVIVDAAGTRGRRRDVVIDRISADAIGVPGARLESPGDWQAATARVGAFASKGDPRCEIELWRGLSDKILWGVEPIRVLHGQLTPEEVGLVDWLVRLGIVEQRDTGTFIADEHSDRLCAFLLDQGRRLMPQALPGRARRRAGRRTASGPLALARPPAGNESRE